MGTDLIFKIIELGCWMLLAQIALCCVALALSTHPVL
jgi:hypothetical protein